MHRQVSALIYAHGGNVIKFDADNVFAHFNSIDSASKCAQIVHDTLRPIEVSIGIGWGDVILLEDDAFGLEFNLTSKAGEDQAGPSETLLTAAARSYLGQ